MSQKKIVDLTGDLVADAFARTPKFSTCVGFNTGKWIDTDVSPPNNKGEWGCITEYHLKQLLV